MKSLSCDVQLAIYTDGACKGNKNVYSKQAPAGWGVVVVDDARQHQIVELYGPVVLDRKSPSYMKALVCSNNTAELTAVGEALLWLRDYGQAYPGPTVIRYDSEYAAKSVQGIFNGSKNQELITHIREILRDVRSTGRELAWEHVKGHSGDEMNDRADYLAGLGASGAFCCTELSRYGGDHGGYNQDEVVVVSDLPKPHGKKARDRESVIDLT